MATADQVKEYRYASYRSGRGYARYTDIIWHTMRMEPSGKNRVRRGVFYGPEGIEETAKAALEVLVGPVDKWHHAGSTVLMAKRGMQDGTGLEVRLVLGPSKSGLLRSPSWQFPSYTESGPLPNV